ncbi:hypothetical protein [uncultured Lutibacter sp.]|uniref:hypothetical protein n=1 Tax=uncultured Lutibacter sp. TaxID=437739 RepID=UPI00260E3ED4|nr:hypothetical protein [uncultured Lutibacter sp.]
MKSIKLFFAFVLFTSLFVSCTSDSISADEQLYANDQIEQANGGETTGDIMRTRD